MLQSWKPPPVQQSESPGSKPQLPERLAPVLRQQLVEAQRVAAEQEQQRNEEVLEELVKWVDNTAPQLWDDNHEDALSTFTSLLEQGVARDPQTALKMVGGLYPEFNPLAAEDVP